jgi:hypothetical protein
MHTGREGQSEYRCPPHGFIEGFCHIARKTLLARHELLTMVGVVMQFRVVHFRRSVTAACTSRASAITASVIPHAAPPVSPQHLGCGRHKVA